MEPWLDIDNVQTSIAPGPGIWTKFIYKQDVRLVILILIVLFLYYAVCTQLSNYVRVARGAVFCLFQTQRNNLRCFNLF